MKETNLLLLLFLFYNLFSYVSLQQIIIPIDPDIDDNGKENEKDEEEDKPVVETKEIRDNKGNNIKITRIRYNKTKNLNGDLEAITPFQMMRIFDNRINSIFEDFIRESMGIKLLLNGLSKIEEEDENDNDNENENQENVGRNQTGDDEFDIEKEFELDDDEENEAIKGDKMNNTVKDGVNITEKKERRILRREKIGKNYTRIGKLNVNLNNIKGNIKKKKKKLSRRELIFSRVCKYIFYSIILFTIYILVKKLLEILEIIDPDNATDVKIENDEMTTLKKTGNKTS